MNRRISAHYVFPVNSAPIRNGIIEIDEQGSIVKVINPGKEIKEQAGVEFYNGILVPGFVNTHCHIELSHLKNKIPQHTRLHNFVGYVSRFRNTDEQFIRKAIEKADFEMQKNGIVALGDISNNALSIEIKKKSKIKYHTFIETFSLDPALADKKIEEAKKLQQKFSMNNLDSSIVPHAPYSISTKLFDLLKKIMQENKSPVTIHNQETASENELFKNKSGILYETFKSWGIEFQDFYPTGKNSLASVINYLPPNNNCILVHNTFSKKEDIQQANTKLKNIYWTFCPNANLYIENSLPDIQLFYRENQKCCIGTDSLASNTQLSILEELKTIQNYFPEIPLHELIKWATLNGAQALNLHSKFGSFEQGKQSCINLITGIDYKNMRLSKKSTIKVLV
ncbi:MAG: amidohydrolase family protein [Bacteroidales bacterium]|nr:amidohydrolase family protein [Bacteroidales bacterium]